ncbi:hypothetical protein K1719_013637 [Acacia pycnantha]|nr:hypothetical protein K1719_013637 [Acacia pycnantha]
MLNTDLEKQGTSPAEVEAFRRKILEADSILFASPEYNFSVTAPLKNAMDWESRPPNTEFFLNAFEPPPKFNPHNGDLIDEDAKLRLKQMLLSLNAFTPQLHHNN